MLVNKLEHGNEKSWLCEYYLGAEKVNAVNNAVLLNAKHLRSKYTYYETHLCPKPC